MTHVYFGDGKGKTTAAIGLGVRACGRGMRVLLVQFLKGSDSGELAALSYLPGITVLPGPNSMKFTFQMDARELQEAARLCALRLEEAVQTAARENYDLLILDELLDTVDCGLLPDERLTELVRTKPDRLELVLTGRNPSKEILSLADYVTEMKKVKHPFDSHIPARRGIEF